MGGPGYSRPRAKDEDALARRTPKTFGSQPALFRCTICAAAHEPRKRESSDQAAAGDGKVTVNVLPLPSSLETSTCPPWASTIRRVM